MLVFHISCVGNQDDIVKKRLPIYIYESIVSTNGDTHQEIGIQVKAYADNGCYSDLEISLIELDNTHFLLKATGLFQSSGVCPAVIIPKDTVITFVPALEGEYFFQTNEAPFEIKRDTIEVT